jgi:hypothetical protein
MKLLNSIDQNCFGLPCTRENNVRKVKAESKIRSLFISTGARNFPKKEYIRCKLIRGHKRILRTISEKIEEHGNAEELFEFPSSKLYYWRLIVDSFLKHREYFTNIIPVEVGPVNELMKRKKQKIDHLKRSFNADYCRDYLVNPETRESYSYYIEYLFSEISCEKLIKIFGFKCCDKSNHRISCHLKWIVFKKYCSQTILKDIEIVPYESNHDYHPLPFLGSII